MQKFTAKFASLIQGVISGADRLVLRGSLRAIQYQFGMMGYLWHKQVLLTGFGKHAEQITKQIKEASLAQARRLLRPLQYLTSSKTDEDAGRTDRGAGPSRKRFDLRAELRGAVFEF